MKHTEVTTHEQLLLFAIHAQVRRIQETSSDIRYECRRLQRWAHRYAGLHDLELVLNDSLFGIVYDDAEQDTEIAARIAAEEEAAITPKRQTL